MSGRLHRPNEEHLDFFPYEPPLYALRIFDSKLIALSKPSAKRATEPDAIGDEKPKGIKATQRHAP